VSDHHRCHLELPVHAHDQLIDLLSVGWVQAGRRLVIQNDPWRQGDRSGQGDPLPHPARQVGRLLVLGALEPYKAERLRDPLSDLTLRHGCMFPERVGDVLRHREGIEERRTLEDHPDLLPDPNELIFRQRYDVLPLDENLARLRLEQANDQLQSDALADPAPADDGNRLTRLDREIHSGQDRCVVERFVDLAELDGRAAHFTSPPATRRTS